MAAEQDLINAHANLIELETRTTAQRLVRNATLQAALDSGVTWKRAQEITGLSPRGVQISLKKI